jgi:MEMO1 family protein
MVSPIAGHWYSGDENSLRSEIEGLRKDILAVRRKNVCAAVVPHAGYRYSGRVAAGVYQRVDARGFQRILVLGPSHYCTLRNKISVPDASHYKTPLGLINADQDFIARLRKLSFVTCETAAHVSEHSDQIQLPLIQVMLGVHAPVVCMVCGQFDSKNIMNAADQLQALLDEKTLLVVSSDFTRYGETYGFVPFNQEVQRNTEMLDRSVFEMFVRKDVQGFLEKLNHAGSTLCERDPLALLLAMLPVDADVKQIAYETARYLPHEDKNSISYIGAIVTGTWHQPIIKE